MKKKKKKSIDCDGKPAGESMRLKFASEEEDRSHRRPLRMLTGTQAKPMTETVSLMLRTTSTIKI